MLLGYDCVYMTDNRVFHPIAELISTIFRIF